MPDVFTGSTTLAEVAASAKFRPGDLVRHVTGSGQVAFVVRSFHVRITDVIEPTLTYELCVEAKDAGGVDYIAKTFPESELELLRTPLVAKAA